MNCTFVVVSISAFILPIFSIVNAFKEINYILFAIFIPREQRVDIFMEFMIISLRPFFQVEVTSTKSTILYGEGFLCRELFLSVSVTLFL